MLVCSYYNRGVGGLEHLIVAANGRLSPNIDPMTTIIVTGLAHAHTAMDAAMGSHDRYTLALREKISTDRPG